MIERKPPCFGSTDRLAGGYAPQLGFGLRALTAKPVLNNLSMDTTGNTATVHFEPSVPSLVSIEVVPIEGGLPGKATVFGDSFGVDTLGLPMINHFRGKDSITVSGLSPKTQYRFHLRAMGEGGIVSDTYEQLHYTTPGPPAFEGPFAIRFDLVNGFVVQWNSKVIPSKATITVKFARKAPLDSVSLTAEAKPSSTAIEVALPIDKWASAGLDTASSVGTPVIVIAMEHPELAKPASFAFTLGIVVPPKDSAKVNQ